MQARTRTRKRTEPKKKRQEQLIRATISCIAKNGLSDTTIASVAGEAGLSQGIVNLHFQSKERLLLETLGFVVDEYKLRWEKALERAGPSSAEQLAALVDVDFDRSVCDRNKLAVWFAFWSETKSRPTYRKLCAERDREYDLKMQQLCRDIISEGGYRGVNPDSAAKGLAAMSEGLWLDMLISPMAMSRQRAKSISKDYLAHVFPAHFGRPARRRRHSDQQRQGGR